MSCCPSEETLLDFLQGSLAADEEEQIDNHLPGCDSCRKRLEEMLRTASVTLLDPVAPAAKPLPQPLPDESTVPGEEWPGQVGNYVTLGVLGRGGMGVVLRVRDPKFNRPLALKLLLNAYKDHAELRQRFREEARLMGQLQHPGIPPVHDLGQLPDGRPYFVMKLIKGQTLAALLRDRGVRRQGAGVRNEGSGQRETNQFAPKCLFPDRDPSLLTSPLLGIFDQVCQTIAYTHAHNIIHRDLKPSNVMVGSFGEVQVMDWGLAKLLAPLEAAAATVVEATPPPTTIYSVRPGQPGSGTQPGTAMGTPAYMAPEQARGETERLDQRCDVFCLGAILCELLTGKPAFDAATALESHRLAMKGDLSDALARLASCGAYPALIELARRCLAPEREDRLPDAGAVAQAVAQFQADMQQRLQRAEIERVQAQIKTAEEHKWLLVERQKRRMAVTLVTVIAAGVLAAAGAGLWYFQDQALRDAQKETIQQEIAAVLAREEHAQRELLEVLTNPRKVHTLLSDIDQWKAILDRRQALLERADGLIHSGGGLLADDWREKVDVQKAVLKADSADWGLARQLDDIRSLAETAVGNRYESAEADKAYVEFFARQQLDILSGRPAEIAAKLRRSPARLVVVAALDHWAEVAAREKLAAILEVVRRTDPDPWRGQVREAFATASQQQLAELARNGKLDEQSPQTIVLLAVKLPVKNATALLEKALLSHPRDFLLHFRLGMRLTDPREQAGCFRAALVLRPNSATTHNNLGVVLVAKGDLDAAIAHYEKAIALDKKQARFYWNHANALLKKLKLRKAGPQHLDKAVTLYKKLVELAPNDVEAHINLGLTLARKKQLTEAAAALSKATKLDPNSIAAHTVLGVTWSQMKKLDAARQELQTAANLCRKAGRANPGVILALGHVLLESKDFAGAIRELNQAILLSPKNAVARYELGLALKANGKLDEASAQFEEAIRLDRNYPNPHVNLGNILLMRKQLNQARAHYERAIAINPQDEIARRNLELVLQEQGQTPRRSRPRRR
jgi:serine/threonine protein kinase/Flp pilus assembly protein TadD